MRRFEHMMTVRRYLESRVRRLNSPHKEVLMSHYISGMSFREISTLYDIPVKRIYYLHGAALKKFEKQFGDEYQGCETFDVRIKETGVGGITVKYEMNERIPFDGTAENDNIRTALQKLKKYWEC